MARCPTCGTEVETPNKEWNLGKIYVKQYDCCMHPRIYKDCLGAKGGDASWVCLTGLEGGEKRR